MPDNRFIYKLISVIGKLGKYKTTVMSMAVVVVFITTYLLILPALTLEKTEAEQQGGIDIPVIGSESITFDGDTYRVLIADDEGVLPDGILLNVDEIDKKNDSEDYINYYNEALSAINNEEGGEVLKDIVFARFYDITLMSDGKEIEPAEGDKLSVRIEYDQAIRKELGVKNSENLHIIHFTEDEETGDLTAEILDTEENNVQVDIDSKHLLKSAEFDSDSFSVYALVYTADFHWEANGKTYEFGIPGGGYTSLSQLVEALGFTDKLDSFVPNVENIEFSSNDLVWTGRIEEESTVGEIKSSMELDCVYSSELTEEQIAEINAQTVDAGDWAIISLKPFDTIEELTVTMKNGEQFKVKVTDAQLTTYAITAGGETFEITVTYDESAGIPDGAILKASEIEKGTEDYTTCLNQSLEAMGISKDEVESESDRVAFARFFDIKILSDGKEIEPENTVNVEISYINGCDVPHGFMQVVHFAKTGTELITAAAVYSDEETRISFSQDSFSATGTVVTRNPMDFDGEYMIVYQAGDGKYYAYTNDNSKVEVIFNPSKMTVNYPGDGNPVWNVADCYNYQYFNHGEEWRDHFAFWGQVNNNQYITLPAYSNTILVNGWNSVILESAGNGKYTMKNGSGNRYLGWNNGEFASVRNASQAIPFYMVKVEPIDEIDTSDIKVDERVHYIVTDHYVTESGSIQNGDIVRADGYLEAGQSIPFSSNPVSGQEYAGVTVTAGHEAVTIGNSGSVTVSHDPDIHLVHVDYYYKVTRASVEAAVFTDDDKYDTKTVDGEKHYELSEERLHTEKTASVVEDGDGRSFNLTLEAWNVDWNIATVGMVLDASGSMAWDGAPGHYMQVNNDGKYEPYKFLSQEEVNKILYTDYSDYSVAGYGDYTYYVYEPGKSVNEYAPLGYYAGANHSSSYLTLDGTAATRYATQQNISQGTKGWYYVNTASASPFNTIGGAKEYNGIQTNRNKSGNTPYSNKDFNIPIGNGQTKHINFYQPNSYDNDFKAWLSPTSDDGKYRTEADYNAGSGTPAQFYVDNEGYLCCFFYHSNEAFQSYVYAKQDGEPIKTEMLQDAIGSFVSTMDSVAPDSAFGMTRFSRSNTTNTNGFDDNQLPLLNWTTDSETIIGSLNMAYGGEYKANSSKTDTGYEGAGSLTVYDYGLTSNTSTQSGLTSFNTYLATDTNNALTKWIQDNAKPTDGGYEYDKYVIVFTDGKDTDLSSAAHRDRARNAANQLKAKGYSVITVLLAPDSAFNGDSLNQEFTDAKDFLDTLNGPYTGGTGLDWTDQTFIATAADKSALREIFQDIANHIAKSLTDMTVRDYIDPRFQLVDENDNPISVGPHPELGFTLGYDAERNMQYVEWTGQTIPTNNVMDNTVIDEEGKPADVSLWSQTIRVRAKDDFLGGNEVLSNANVEELNKVYPDGHPGTTDPKTSRTFPRTTVDPELLPLELGSTEDTVFLGETINAAEHSKLENAIGSTVESSWYYEYLDRYGTATGNDYITSLQQGTKIEIPYYYFPEGTIPSEFNGAQLNPNNVDAYMKDRLGTLTYEWVPCDADGNEITILNPYNYLTTNTDDIHYRLKIKYEPYSEDGRDSYVNQMIDNDDYGRPVKDPVGTPQTKLESEKDEGIATVHVVSGQLTVSKQVKKEDILKYLEKNDSAEFTFKLTKTGTPSSEYPSLGTDYTDGHGEYTYPSTISVTVTESLVNAAEVTGDGYVTITGTTVQKLPIGTYEIEENAPDDPSFELDSMGHLTVDANYRASVTDGSAKVSFEIGELASDADVTDPVQESKEYLNAQRVSVYARNTVKLPVPVSIKKVDVGNTSVLLGNAVFSLYGSDAVDGSGNIKQDAVPISTGITTDADDDLGFADLDDLPYGTYYLVETSAPAGYILPDYEYIKITVEEGSVTYQEGKIGEPKVAVLTERNEQEVYLLEVNNTAGVELPFTGGIGTTIFYILGALLVLGCGIFLFSRRRIRS